MTSKTLTSTVALMVALLAALPASAQKRSAFDAGSEKPPTHAKANSPYCSFTYFTNEADQLEFRGSDEVRCFDMKGGDDILILNREAFPAGVKLFTGTGRDTVWTTDGDDVVRDPDGNDKEIRTYGGNDRIEIEAPIEDDPFRGVGKTERTEIRPGTGENEVIFSLVPRSNAFARYSPDVWLTTEPTAHDKVRGTCGRHTILGDFDFRTMEVPENSKVTYDLDGCNVGIFGLYGDADVTMSGGRLALQTFSDGFRIPAGENLPKITGEVGGGLGLTMDIDKSSPESNFTWEGSGNAFLRSRMDKEGSGGVFRIFSAREVSLQGELEEGDARFDLAAKGVVKLDLVTRGQGSLNSFNIAASRMDVSWRLAGDGGFPEIINDVPMTYKETTFILPEIDWSGSRSPTSEAQALSAVVDPDEAVIPDLPDNVPNVEKTRADVDVRPGNTRLRLQLRRDNDRFGKCVGVKVIDHEGVAAERSAQCDNLQDQVTRLVVLDAKPFDEIVVSGDGVDLRIPMNSASRFKVDRLEIEY